MTQRNCKNKFKGVALLMFMTAVSPNRAAVFLTERAVCY